MPVRDRIVDKQEIYQMMACMDDELRGIAGGYPWSTLENTNKYKAGDQQQGFRWAYYFCGALFCVLCSICVLCVLDVLGLI